MFSISQASLASILILFSFGCNLQTLNESSAITFNDIGRYLLLPIKDIPHVNILVRKEYLHNDTDNIYTLWFLQHINCPHTIATYESESDLDSVPVKRSNIRDSFVIVTTVRKLFEITETYTQKAGTFFYILVDSEIDYEKLLMIFQELWLKRSIFKSYILIFDRVLIYDPFEFSIERQTYGQLKTYIGEQRLDRLLFSDMRGYPMRIQFFKSVYARPVIDKETRKIRRAEGVDARVMRMLQAHMNFTINLQEPDPDYFGERLPNGSYNGAIGSIIRNQIDMCLTGFFVKDYLAPEMAFTVAMYDDKLCIYVPKAKRIPQSILPIFSVGYELWLCFILTAFICGAIWWFIRYLNLLQLTKLKLPNKFSDIQFRWQMIRIVIDTWVVWVRVNILSYPPFHSERIFLASLCLVSVIFGAIFESSLATVYIHPLYYKDINTLKELDDSGLKVIYKYAAMADDLFFSEASPIYASLNNKLVLVSDLNADVTLEIALYGGKASVTRQISFMLETMPYVLAKQIWMVPECPKYYTISYVLPKDSPFEETVNRLLLRCLNAGLIRIWINELHARVVSKIMKEYHFQSDEIFKVLQVTDLQLAFYVVVLGSILGFASLFAEKYAKRRERKRRKKRIHEKEHDWTRSKISNKIKSFV